jgi:WD40 repeat protein
MFKRCDICSEKAIKQCLCSSQFFCQQHCGEHVAQRGNHHFIEIALRLDPEQRLQLTEEISSRIKTIQQCKAKIAEQSSILINKIGEFSTFAIEKLEKFESEYLLLMKTTEYSETQIKAVHEILRTELQLKLHPYQEILGKIEEYYHQDFCVQVLASKMKGFLKLHTAFIKCVAATKDKQTLISGGDDCVIKIWSVSGKRVISILEGHTKCVKSIAISVDDCFLVSGSNDQTVRLWSLGDGKPIFQLNGHTQSVNGVAVSNDCRWIASGSADMSVCVWSFNEGQLHIRLTQQLKSMKTVAFRGNSLYSGSDKCLIEWDIESFNQRTVIETTGEIWSLDITEDQAQIVIGFTNGMIQLWQKMSLLKEFSGHTNAVTAVKFDSKNKRIISASYDYTVRVWGIDEECELKSFNNHSSHVACLAAIIDDCFVSGSHDASMIIWNTSTLMLDSIIQSQRFYIHEIMIDEDHLIYPSGNSVNIWNMNSNCLDFKFEGHSEKVYCVSFYSDFIISGSKDFSVRIWSRLNMSQVVVFEGHTSGVLAVTMCGDLIASGSADHSVRLWNIKEKKEIGVLIGHTGYVRGVALTSSLDKVVSGSADRTVRVWAINGLQLLFVLAGHKHRVQNVRITKDDNFVFSGSVQEESVRVWDLKAGSEVGLLKNLQQGEEWILKYPEIKVFVERFII